MVLSAVDPADNEAIGLGASRIRDTRTYALRPHVDIVDKGADLTGVTDATSIIEAADVALGAAGGGDLFFPPGTYKCNVEKSGANVRWLGCRGASILKPGDASAHVIDVKVGAAFTGIKGLTLDGNATGQSGLYFSDNGGIQFLLEDFEVKNFAAGNGYGISNSGVGTYSMLWKRVKGTGCKIGFRLIDKFDNFNAIGLMFYDNLNYNGFMDVPGAYSRTAGVNLYGPEFDFSTSGDKVNLYAKKIQHLSVLGGYFECFGTNQLDFELDTCSGKLVYSSNGNLLTNYSGKCTNSYISVEDSRIYGFLNASGINVRPWNKISGNIDYENVDWVGGYPYTIRTFHAHLTDGWIDIECDTVGNEWLARLKAAGGALRISNGATGDEIMVIQNTDPGSGKTGLWTLVDDSGSAATLRQLKIAPLDANNRRIAYFD